MQLNINTDAAVIFTDRLEAIGKSALPNAVRETLSKAALDVKKNTMPKTADKEFELRRKNFFRANSIVDFAQGKNISSMRSAVGFFENKLSAKTTNFAVKDLEQQEYGGDIDGKSFIPLDNARIGKSYKKSVRANARISGFKNLPNVSNAKGANWKQRAIKTAVFTGVGKYMLATSGRVGSIYKITSIRRDKGNTVFKKIKMYSYDKNRKVKVHKTNFMKKSAEETQKNIDKIYVVEAKKQIDKYLGILMK
jgi:hypothetical protein